MIATRGWGPWRRDWHSVCSLHKAKRIDCKLCRTGHWRNRWASAIWGAVFIHLPSVWRWWVNRGPMRFVNTIEFRAVETFDCLIEGIEGKFVRVRTWSSGGEEATAWIETAKIPAELVRVGGAFKVEVYGDGWQIKPA